MRDVTTAIIDRDQHETFRVCRCGYVYLERDDCPDCQAENNDDAAVDAYLDRMRRAGAI